ncbi:MAG: ChbG/HpnK family deacetylase, partial [Acidobacteriales bacterium]|nr:ChbG/HpnK family deacetylase [Terriglobales bacterium]
IVLTDGIPLLPGSEIPSLVSGRQSPVKRFHDGLTEFSLRVLTGRIDPAHVEAESTAQVRKLQSSGIALSHVDTHKHVHMFPQILRPVLRAARACGVPAVRNPFDPTSFSVVSAHTNLWMRYGQVSAARRMAQQFRRIVADAGMITTDGTPGVVVTGALSERIFRTIVANLGDGTWEFVCHPGHYDAALQNSGTRLLQSRERELEILTSPNIRDFLVEQKVQLVSYRDLSSPQPRRERK